MAMDYYCTTCKGFIGYDGITFEGNCSSCGNHTLEKREKPRMVPADDLKVRLLYLKSSFDNLLYSEENIDNKSMFHDKVDSIIKDLCDTDTTRCGYCGKLIPDADINRCVDCGEFYCENCGDDGNGTCTVCEECPK